MAKKLTFINKNNFNIFLDTLAKSYCVVTPYGDIDYIWQEYKSDFIYNSYRPIVSIRQFFTPATEHIDNYFTTQAKAQKSMCIVGAKACDLTSLLIQDYIFLEGDIDRAYKNMRDNNLIISGDCTAFKNVCFCLALEINPYPEKLFDLNITPVQNGYLVEVGSEKGLKTVRQAGNLFENPDDGYLIEQERKRKDIVEKLSVHLSTVSLPPKSALFGLIKNGYNDIVWQEEALRCVECGACIMNCPTCHCFLLFDAKSKNEYLRSRIWDGCQYRNFTRVAGGANALKFREYRLRNRYIKKFEFFYERLNFYACTGCGRCIECCPGKIDLQKIFKRLAQNELAKTSHE